MSSTMGLKVQYKCSDENLITKDVKCNPLSTCLALKLEAASLFNIYDHRKYALYYRRQLIPSYNSLKESSVSPGSVLTMAVKSESSSSSKPVSISVRTNQSNRLVKVSGTFSSEHLFLNALQSLKDGEKSFNVLQRQQDTLPILTMGSSQMDWKMLKCLAGYTFNDLDIQGNHMFSVQYVSATASDVERFNSALEPCSAQEYTAVKSVPTLSVVPAAQESNTVSILKPQTQFVVQSENTIQFSISKQLTSSESAPDLPDSFYDLTIEEFKSCLGGYKRTVSNIVDRPLASAKHNQQRTSPVPKDSVLIKFVFPDNVCATALIPSSLKACELYSFLKNDIVTEDSRFNLLIGPPIKIIQPDEKTLTQIGILSSTKIIVDCSAKDIKYKVQL